MSSLEAKHTLAGAIGYLDASLPLMHKAWFNIKVGLPGFPTSSGGAPPSGGMPTSRTETLATGRDQFLVDLETIERQPRKILDYALSVAGLQPILAPLIDQHAPRTVQLSEAELDRAIKVLRTVRSLSERDATRALSLAQELWGCLQRNTAAPGGIEGADGAHSGSECRSCVRLHRPHEPVFRRDLCRRCHGLVERGRDRGLKWELPPEVLVDYAHQTGRISEREFTKILRTAR